MTETERKKIEQLEGEVFGLSLTLDALLSKLNMGDDFDLTLREVAGKIGGVSTDQISPDLPLRIKERRAAFTIEMVLSFAKEKGASGPA